MISHEHKLPVLLQGLAGDGVDSITVSGLSLDSRQLNPGDAFIAVAGTHAHGLDFLDKALEKKPAVVIYEPSRKYLDLHNSDVPMIAVSDLHRHVSLIASRFYNHPSREMNLIAITGTNGKTTCAYLLTQLLSSLDVDAAMIGTIGSGRIGALRNADLTTPDAVTLQARLAELKESGVTHVVMEASSHALDQHRMDAVEVDVAAFTNLSRDHLDYHADMAEYLKAKARLFSFASLSFAVINMDDTVSQKLFSLLSDDVKTTGFSLEDKTADVYAHSISADATATHFETIVNDVEFSVVTGLIGKFNVSNLLLVIAVMQALGFDVRALVKEIMSLQPPKGRMQRMGSESTPMVVIDYAHTPDALEKALFTLKQLPCDELTTVFGCGGDRDRNKRAMMGAAAETFSDRIYLTDDNPRTEDSLEIIADIRSGIKGSDIAQIVPDRAKAIRVSIQAAGVRDIVLIAGKGHEEYQIIGKESFPFSDQYHAQTALNIWQEQHA